VTHKEHADTKRILVLSTGHKGSRGAGRDNTGLWFADLAEFVDEFGDDDYVIDIASPNGGAIPLDPRSIAEDGMSAACRGYYDDPAFMLRLQQSIPLSNITWRDYEAVYLPGRQGALWDLATDTRVATLVGDAYEGGRVVSSVGYGLAGLLNARLSDGSYLLAGRKVTAPSAQDEHASHTSHLPLHVEEQAQERGAKFDSAADPAAGLIEVDGRLVTGQSVLSARKVAQAVFEQIKPHHH
jgi:putative intracellular protease/amidase